MGVAELVPCAKGPGEVSSTVHQVIGRQTSIQAVEPARSCELVPAPPHHSWGTLVGHLFGKTPADKRALVEEQVSQEEIPDFITANKNLELVHAGEGLKTNFSRVA